MASFAPPLPAMRSDTVDSKPPSLIKPMISAGSVQTSARADIDAFTRDILNPSGTPPVEDEEVASQTEYDDDHPDEEAYQPFPILPFRSDTPIAEMDMTDSEPDFSLSKVHMMFSEHREMFDTRFRPGLQFAELFWAQRFRGTAVNTGLRRVAREDDEATPVRTAQQTAK
jgi:hypothetical protein